MDVKYSSQRLGNNINLELKKKVGYQNHTPIDNLGEYYHMLPKIIKCYPLVNKHSCGSDGSVCWLIYLSKW
jgi:hypothetical protein